MRPILTFLLLAAVALVSACRPGSKRDTATTATATAHDSLNALDLALFAPLPEPGLDLKRPEIRARVSLGRTLYHETLLSEGHDVSCNTCHPLNGYGADGRPRSFGDLGHTGGRNAPTVYNAAWHVAQFWDGRAPNLEEQAKGPILNPVEMAMPAPEAVLAHLRDIPAYREAFLTAFPGESDPITYDNVGRAIATFERGLVTPARWDRYLKGDHAALTAQEARGANTFVTIGCVGCHNGALVGGSMFQRLGARTPWPDQADSGRYQVSGEDQDLFVFKVPALRNVEKTGPYFHDGSVGSLEEAIRLMGRYQLGSELTDRQVEDIRAWLGSLTGSLPGAYVAQPQLPPG